MFVNPADKIHVSITTSTGFTGVSQYASDFQAELSKALTVAQIPVTLLQSQDTNVISKETALGNLNAAATALGTSLTSLGTLASQQALTAISSDSTVISATNTGSTVPANYTINSVTSIAVAASERSTASYGDSASTPVSTTGIMSLVVGSTTYPLTVTKNNLTGVRDQINALGAGVTASILTTSGGNYLSISATATGHTTLQLIDDPITATNPTGANTNVLTTTGQGTDAVFQLNGINVDQPGNVVNNVVPGLTFNILAASTTPTTITMATDPTQLSAALSDFVTNYNALQTQIATQVGPNAGPLSEDMLVNQLQSTLRQLTSYTTSTGTVQSLSDLGIEFSNTGVASLNQTTFSALSATQISDGFKFLGSATTGFAGFAANLTEFTDPLTGLIQSEQAGFKQQDTDLQAQMTTLNARITANQASLTAQLEAADAQQAELQSQQQGLTGSLAGLSLVLYGKAANS